jgi:protein TonB
MRHTRKEPLLRRVVHFVLVLLGASTLTLVFFLVLPVIQAITAQPEADTLVQGIDAANIPPPPAPPEEEPEPEPEEEEKPPELVEEAPPLDLAQLEVALNPGVSDGWLGGDFAVKLTTTVASSDDVDALFSLADLDQEPRAIHRPPPAFTAELRKKAPATVYIVFDVDQRGRVENPIVQQSTDPLFDKAALAAVKKWKFEPGKRNGQPVKFRMRTPITFPKKS